MSSSIIYEKKYRDKNTNDLNLYIKFMKQEGINSQDMKELYRYIDSIAAIKDEQYHIILDLSVFPLLSYVLYIKDCLSHLRNMTGDCVKKCTVLVPENVKSMKPAAQTMLDTILCSNKKITIKTLSNT